MPTRSHALFSELPSPRIAYSYFAKKEFPEVLDGGTTLCYLDGAPFAPFGS